MKIEPVARSQLGVLLHAVGSLQTIILCLNEVDLAKGRGVLEGNIRCLWTHDKHRITISPLDDGGLFGSVSQDPDPECP